MAIDKNNFWDENYYKHPPLTDEMVADCEQQLGIKLPGLLIDLLKIQNGGYTKGFVFPMTEETTWAKDHVLLSELLGIVPDKSISTAQNILDSGEMAMEWGLPPKQVLLCGDGHWWITLDYRLAEEPSVRWIDTECDEDIFVAKNFEEFIYKLIPEGELPETE